MKVKFKGNNEPCVEYKVLNGPLMQFDEVKLNGYAMCYELEVLGWVPVQYLEETTCPLNVSAIDVAIKLSVD